METTQFVNIDPIVLDYILRCNGIRRANLSDPESRYYCGVSYKTISNGVYEKRFSKRTFNAIMNQVDISNCVVDNPGDHSEYRITIQANRLVEKIHYVQRQLNKLQDDLTEIDDSINDILNKLKG
jgi:hypothetical protein